MINHTIRYRVANLFLLIAGILGVGSILFSITSPGTLFSKSFYVAIVIVLVVTGWFILPVNGRLRAFFNFQQYWHSPSIVAVILTVLAGLVTLSAWSVSLASLTAIGSVYALCLAAWIKLIQRIVSLRQNNQWLVKQVAVYTIPVLGILVTLLLLSIVGGQLFATVSYTYPKIMDSFGDVRINFTQRPVLTVPDHCLTVIWQVKGAAEVDFNSVNTEGESSRVICNTRQTTAALTVKFGDGESKDYTLPLLIPYGPEVVVSIAFFCLLPMVLLFYLFTASLTDFWVILLTLFLPTMSLMASRLNTPGWVYTDWFSVAAILALLIGGLCWFVYDQQHRTMNVRLAIVNTTRKTKPRAVWYYLAIPVGLIAFTYLFYYTPAKQHFWMGYDEFLALRDTYTLSYNNYYDMVSGRWFAHLSSTLVSLVDSESLYGFFWVAAGLRLLTALGIFGVIQELWTRGRPIALAAALLFLISPTEISRYLVVDMENYFLYPAMLMLATLFFVHGYKHEQRTLLWISAVLLAVSLLGLEVTFLIAIFVPLLLLRLPRRPVTVIWLITWYSVIAIVAFRFVLFYLFATSQYQSGFSSLQQILSNFYTEWATLGRYFLIPKTVGQNLPSMFLAFIVSCILFYRIAGSLNPIFDRPRRTRALLTLLEIAVLEFMLGILAYLPATDSLLLIPTFRTLYYSSIGQAVIIAAVIFLIANLLRTKYRRLFLTVVLSGIISLSVGIDFAYQTGNDVIYPGIKPGNNVRFANQMTSLIGSHPQNTTVFVILQEGLPEPLGYSYYLNTMSCSLWGITAYQGIYSNQGLEIALQELTGYPADFSFPLHVPAGRKIVFVSVDADGIPTLVNLPVPSSIFSRDGSEPLNCSQLPYTPELLKRIQLPQ